MHEISLRELSLIRSPANEGWNLDRFQATIALARAKTAVNTFLKWKLRSWGRASYS